MRGARSLACLAFAALSAAACSGGQTVERPPPPPVDWHAFEWKDTRDAGPDIISTREREEANNYVEGLASPEFAKLKPLLDDDTHFFMPGFDEARSADRVFHTHDVLFGPFGDRKVAATRVWRTPTEQAIEWTLTGTDTQLWLGVEPTKKNVGFKGLTLLWTSDDGSIDDIRMFFDTTMVKAQLGSGPGPKWMQAMPPATMPTAPAQVMDAAGSPEEKSNVAIVRANIDALENNDGGTAYVAAMADTVEVYSNCQQQQQPAGGKAEALKYFKMMHAAIKQLNTTASNVMGVGPFVVADYRIDGEQTGPVCWVTAPAGGSKVLRLEIADVVEVRSEKIQRVWRYDNLAELLQ